MLDTHRSISGTSAPMPLRDRSVPHIPASNGNCKTYFSDVDLDGPGRSVGFLYIPQSPDHDAWGTVRIPLAVVANGTGPTVIVEAGNHGDEYEGQIIVGELIRSLAPSQVQGRLILVPSVNIPASTAGKRTSPDDGLNLNRVFPGDHAGSITQQIAAFFSDELLSRADAFLSLHSGGSSLDIVPSALVQPAQDPFQQQRNLDAVLAFGASINVQLNNLGDTRTCVASAVAAGLTCVSTEMAGRGTVDRDALALCRRGVFKVLQHWGVLDSGLDLPRPEARTLHRVLGPQSYIIAGEDGVFEGLHHPGEPVCAGETAGRIHFLTDPRKLPVVLTYTADGIVFARRQPRRVRPGNVCAVVATPDS